MSNAVVFVPIEFRVPKMGEWIKAVSGEMFMAAGFGKEDWVYRRLECPPDWKAPPPPEPPAPELPVLVPTGHTSMHDPADGKRLVTILSTYRAVPLAELRRVPEIGVPIGRDPTGSVMSFEKGYRACLAKLGIHP